ncbi:hypothetical protein KCU68_g22635, partial [Aureobasidium melanogenum]
DHINYLILRYLQEAGHENAARALHQDWHRPQEYGDPEKLPFAPLVKQHELVHIIQDAIFHDQLLAQVTNQSRRFNLTTRQFAHRSSTDRRPSTNQHDFPLPPAKRSRKSNDSLNPDSMHIDPTPQDHDQDADRDPTPDAPDPEHIPTTSSATQTDKKLKSKSETMYWALDQPDASIMHALWNPKLSHSTRLLTVGESLCRFYDLPHHTKNG